MSFEINLTNCTYEKMNKHAKAAGVILGTFVALVLSQGAQAAADTTAALAGISDAQTAILAILGGMIALSAAIFGVVKVHAFMSRKSGG